MATETLTLEARTEVEEAAAASLVSQASKLTPQKDDPTVKADRYRPAINFERIMRRIEDSHGIKDFRKETEIIHWIIGSATRLGYITDMESAYLSTGMTWKTREYASTQEFVRAIDERRHKRAILASYRRVPGHS